MRSLELIAIWLAGMCDAKPTTHSLSEVSLLLTYNSVATVNATKGCYYWEASDSTLILEPFFEGTNADCSGFVGTSNAVKIYTPSYHPQDSNSIFKVQATSTSDEVAPMSLDVYLSQLSAIEILTTSRRIGVSDFETLKIQAYDANRNVFSSLEKVPFSWKITTKSKKQASFWSKAAPPVLSAVGDFEKDEISLQGPSLLVSGTSSGSVEVSATFLLTESTSLNTMVQINVVESLKTCPDGLYHPILLSPSSKLQFNTLITELDPKGDKIQRRIDSDSTKYFWNSSFGAITTDGVFSAKKGKGIVKFAEQGFAENYVDTNVHIETPISLVMFASFIELPKLDEAIQRCENYCRYNPSGRFPSYVALTSVGFHKKYFTEGSIPWVFVVGRHYAVIAEQYSVDVTIAIKTPSKHLILNTEELPLVRQVLNQFGESLHDIVEIKEVEGYNNLVTLSGLKTGEGFLRFQTTKLTSALQKILLTNQLTLLDNNPIRLPPNQNIARDEVVIGGTGKYSLQMDENVVASYAPGTDLATSSQPGRSSGIFSDSLDESNFVSADFVVSPPTNWVFFSSKTYEQIDTLSLGLNKTTTVLLVALDVDNQFYSACTSLAKDLTLVSNAVSINANTSGTSGKVCARVTLTGEKVGDHLIRVSGFIKSPPLNVLVRDGLEVAKPKQIVHTHHYLSVTPNTEFDIVLQNGFLEQDALDYVSLGIISDIDVLGEKLNSTMSWKNLDTALQLKVVNVGENERVYVMECSVLSVYVLRIRSDGKTRKVIINCAEPVDAEISYDGVTTEISHLAGINKAANQFGVFFVDQLGFFFSATRPYGVAWTKAHMTEGVCNTSLIPQSLSHKVNLRFDTFLLSDRCSITLEANIKDFIISNVKHVVHFIILASFNPTKPPSILLGSNFLTQIAIIGGSGNFNCTTSMQGLKLELSAFQLDISGFVSGTEPKIAKVVCEDIGLLNAAQVPSGRIRKDLQLTFDDVRKIILGTESEFVLVGNQTSLFAKAVDSRGNNFALSEYMKLDLALQSEQNKYFDVVSTNNTCFYEIQGLETCPGMLRYDIVPQDIHMGLTVSVQSMKTEPQIKSNLLSLVFFPPMKMVPSSPIYLSTDGVRSVFVRGGPGFFGYETARQAHTKVDCNFHTSLSVIKTEQNQVTLSQGKPTSSSNIQFVCKAANSNKVIEQVSNVVKSDTLTSINILVKKQSPYVGNLYVQLVGDIGGEMSDLLLFSAPKQEIEWKVDGKTIITELENEHSGFLNIDPLLYLNGASRTKIFTFELSARLVFQGKSYYAQEQVSVFPQLDMDLEEGKQVIQEVSVPTGDVSARIDVLDQLSSSFTKQYRVLHGDGGQVDYVKGVFRSSSDLELDVVLEVVASPKNASFVLKRLILVRIRDIGALVIEGPTTMALPATVDVLMFDRDGNQMLTNLISGPVVEVYDSLLGVLDISHAKQTDRFDILAAKASSAGFTTLEARVLRNNVDDYLFVRNTGDKGMAYQSPRGYKNVVFQEHISQTEVKNTTASQHVSSEFSITAKVSASVFVILLVRKSVRSFLRKR